MLETRHLTKRFGGVLALDDVSLAVSAGEIHALIGPNGAGKSTLISLLSGTLRVDSGEILFLGRDVARMSTHQRVRSGLARSFQITSIFRRFTVLENLALVVQARSGSSLSFWRPAAAEKEIFDEAASIAGEIGLYEKRSWSAGILAHGDQRALEVGLALATRAQLLLLDEPMAGMGREDSKRMISLIEGIRAQVSVLLVEHDMDAVFRLANRISVLVNGRILASGSPQEIKADPEVTRAYLGGEVAAAG